jgi:hypothetical protein
MAKGGLYAKLHELQFSREHLDQASPQGAESALA